MTRPRHLLSCTAALAFCLLGAFAGPLARAQETGSVQPPSQEELQSIEDALIQSKQRQQALTLAQDAARAEAETLSDRLVTLAMSAAEQEQALATAESRLNKLAKEEAKARRAFAARRDELSRLLSGLMRLQQDPPPALVVQPDDVLRSLRGAMMFSAVVPELRSRADALKSDLKLLEVLKTRLGDERRGKQAALADLAKSRTDIDALISQKQQAAETADQDLVNERKAARDLASKAENLRDLLAKLAEARAKADADAARIAASEEKRLLESKARELAAASAPPPDFAGLKGSLNLPVAGETLKLFGADTGLGHPLPGLALKTVANAQVVSPIRGKIEFAGPFRSYGGLVIINAGGDYLVLLAGMERVLTTTGQFVKAGEPLGEMGLKSAELAISNDITHLENPVLYVEFRKNTAPIDPSPWWVAKTQEAQK